MANLSYTISYRDVFGARDLEQNGIYAVRVEEIMRDSGLREVELTVNWPKVTISGEGTVQDVVGARANLMEARFLTDVIGVDNEEERIYVKYATHGVEARITGN